ncbi:MAG: hypothetical protein II842_20460 [Butyrivibrio sp.]|nr:hypothetical protein [Butyrivibrio sp.]
MSVLNQFLNTSLPGKIKVRRKRYGIDTYEAYIKWCTKAKELVSGMKNVVIERVE